MLALRESHINSSSRVETHSHSNVLSTYDDTNTDDRVKTTYYAKKKCREGTKSPAEKKANRNQYKNHHLTKRQNKINTSKTTGQRWHLIKRQNVWKRERPIDQERNPSN